MVWVRRPLLLATLVLGLAAVGAGCKNPEPKTRGPGDNLKSFTVMNAETGRLYCQVCVFAGKPILMAVAELGDARFEEDLVRMQKLVDASADKGLRAFAVLGKTKDGRFGSTGDDAKAVADVRALKQRLGITFPLVIVPEPKGPETGNNTLFHQAYELKGTPTVYLASRDNIVVLTDVLHTRDVDAQFTELRDAVAKL
ncbi:hypothetical protein L6R52_34600 [Myxococcota bacterium]|nr:hypothetical protein [Myxococcota bacterium]